MHLKMPFFLLALCVMLASPVMAAETTSSEPASSEPASSEPTSSEPTSSEPTFGDYQAKGFLTDYSGLKPFEEDDGTYRYRDASADLGHYNKLLVDRIKLWFKEDSEYKGIDPDELKELTDYFYEAINKAVGDAYPLVTEPGPDVLRLRIAITDVVPNKPSASVTTLVVPFLWVGEAGTGVAKGDTGSTMFTGQASIEFEALDSVSSQQLAAFIETRTGQKYDWTHGVSKGVSSYIKAYSKWDYTKQAMDGWAQLLRERLDALHGKATDEQGDGAGEAEKQSGEK
jgi:hypothetical protein